MVRLNRGLSRASNWLDAVIWGGAVALLSYLFVGIAWLNRFFDEYVVNLGFDKAAVGSLVARALSPSSKTARSSAICARIGFGVALLVIIFIWGCRR